MRRKGFTLIELLVVIAIIAILAAILFPVMTRARAKANQTKCMSNMVQIGKAMMSYSDDYQGSFPLPWNPPLDWYNWDNTWREHIQPYIKSRKILICPAKTSYIPDVQADKRRGHYGMNVYLNIKDGYTPSTNINDFATTCPMSSVQSPTKTILVSENREGDWSAEPQDNDGTGLNGQFYPYHGDENTKGGIFTFCDGHARYMSVYTTQSSVDGVKFYYWKRVKKGS